MTTEILLLVPGETTEWISVESAAMRFCADAKSDEAKAVYSEIAKKCHGIEVKVRVCEFRHLCRWGDERRSVQSGDMLAAAEADKSVLRDGLAEIRGVNPKIEDQDKLHEALTVTGIAWIIAQVIDKVHSLSPEARAGFFTLEQAA